jgi:ketosteroid isomerase-like protein
MRIIISITLLSLVATSFAIKDFVVEDSGEILDQLYNEISRTVKEGDFEGYAATYHEDAVVVYTTRGREASLSIDKALENWKSGFVDTKRGLNRSAVEFRFSKRLADETSAFDQGIFHYTSSDKVGKSLADVYVFFEMLLVKKEGQWLILMEYQQSVASQEEWMELK